MKKYKILLISFILLIFMIGAVNATDNASDEAVSAQMLPMVEIIPDMNLNDDPGAYTPDEPVVVVDDDDDPGAYTPDEPVVVVDDDDGEENNVKEIYVNDTGDDSNVGSKESPYATFIQGLDDARGYDDAVIHLSQGTFSSAEEDYIVCDGYNGNLKIVGAGVDKTFIDGASQAGFLFLDGEYHLTIQNISFINFMNWAGAIYSGSGSITIDNCIFMDSGTFDYDGGVLTIEGGNDLIVTNSQFISTFAEGQGGAISFMGENAYLENNTFISSQSNYGAAAVSLTSSNQTILVNNKFQDIASSSQYVVLVNAPYAVVENNSFINCEMSTIVDLYGQNVIWKNNSFIDSVYDYALATSSYLDGVKFAMDNSVINVSNNEINNGVSVPLNITDEEGNDIRLASFRFNLIGEENNYTYYSFYNNGKATISFSTIPESGIYNLSVTYGDYVSEVFREVNVTLPDPVELWVSPKGFDGNNGTKDNPFETIQHAIDVGFESSFDVIIHLIAGTYSGEENVELTIANKGNLHIIGEKYNETIIDGNNTNWFLSVRNTNVDIENLNFIKGIATGRNNLITGNNNLLLRNCIINNNTVKSNNGYILNDVKFDNLTFTNNYGRIYLSSQKTIFNSLFVNNSFTDLNYGGIIQAENLIIENSKFICNNATFSIIQASTIESKNNYYAKNYAYSLNSYSLTTDIAGVFRGLKTGIFENDTFENNNATYNGVFAFSVNYNNNIPTVNFTDCKFINNSALRGGVGTLSGGYFNNCLFADNSAEYGGALVILPGPASDGKKVEIVNSIFENNLAEINGNDIYLDINLYIDKAFVYLIDLNITYSDLNVTGLVDNFKATVYGPCDAEIGGSSLNFIIDGFNAGSSEIINSQSTLQYAGFEQGEFILTGDIDKAYKNIINNGNIIVNLSSVLDNVEFWVSNDGSDEKGTGSNDSPFKSISHAVSEATKNCRNIVIHIMEGTYTGDLNTALTLSSMNNLTLTGEGMDKTIIDGNGSTYFARIAMGKNKVVFSNMTIMNMAATGDDAKINPIYVDSDANLCMDTVNITKFTSNILGEGYIFVNNSIFSKNIGLVGSSDLLYVNNSLFTSSMGSFGSNVIINNSVIKDILTTSLFTLVSGEKCIIENTLISNDCNNASLEEWGIGEYSSTLNPAVAVISSDVYMNNVTVMNNYASPIYEYQYAYGDGSQLAAFGYLYGFTGKNVTAINSSFSNFKYLWCVNTYGQVLINLDGCVFNNITMIAQSQTPGSESEFNITNSVFIDSNPVIDRYHRGDRDDPVCNFNDNYWGSNDKPVVIYANPARTQSFEPDTWIILTSEDNKTIIKNVTDGENSTDYTGIAPIREGYADDNGALGYAVVFGPVGYLFTTDDDDNVIFNESAAIYPFVDVDPMNYRDNAFMLINKVNGSGAVFGTVVDMAGNPVANATVSYCLDDGEVVNATTDADGKFVVFGGNGVLNMTFIGNDKLFPVEKLLTLENIAPVKTETALEATVKGDMNITSVLKDANGKPIANALITYVANNTEVNTITDENGAFTIPADNNSTIEIKYIGDSTYLPTSVSIALDSISSTRIATKIEADYTFTRDANDYAAGERGAMFYAVLKDINGNPLSNKTCYVAVNGPIYQVTTDDQGRFGVNVNLAAANTYTYALSFLGNEKYEASLNCSKLILVAKKTTISASAKSFKATAKTKTVSVTLKTIKNAYDGKTYLKSGKKLTMKVNGKTYTAKINAKGVAKFNIKITKKGKYTAKISFKGDGTYKASSKSIKITIK